ncbi:hypothetical protein [Lactobacillus crispatus]|uniref:hypothetical protein n=1 Tax=Lactobacillus crispatus TaxID=47770 RepID=UPI0010609CD8|nr:hypothetical protein [Lactobacillus crispatus]TDM88258.1 hypothetical protein CEE95_04430 [Lactobacillus crispatus]TDM96562.1 hypothetical protein CEE89_04335 [Lactobacillus crispatus]TDN28405.1 hypothetical protein CEE74_14055 [Lactobacillus crispatus]
MYKFYLCGMEPKKWNSMSEKDKEDFIELANDLADFAFKDAYQKDTLKKISSEDLLQELINRKVLTQISVGLYKEFELKHKYKNRDKPIQCDAVFVLNKHRKDS